MHWVKQIPAEILLIISPQLKIWPFPNAFCCLSLEKFPKEQSNLSNVQIS